MATYKFVGEDRHDIPRYDLHLHPGDTFVVPDEDTSLDNNPLFSKSRTQSPDYTVDPEIVAAETAPTVDGPPAPTT